MAFSPPLKKINMGTLKYPVYVGGCKSTVIDGKKTKSNEGGKRLNSACLGAVANGGRYVN